MITANAFTIQRSDTDETKIKSFVQILSNYYYIFLLFLFSFSSSIHSQDCGTVLTPSQVQLERERIAAGIDFSFLKRQQVHYYVPITLHIIRRTNGTGGLSLSQLEQAMIDLNDGYLDVQFEFLQEGEIDYIDDDGFYFSTNSSSQYNALRQTNVVEGSINVYFVPSESGFPYCGLSSFSSSSIQGIIMNNNCSGVPTNPSTFPHEVGHYFDLYHTHETFMGLLECPSGSNCNVAGDLICDTPADPNLGGHVSPYPACNYDNYASPPGGCDNTPYNPQTENLMSYSQKQCRDLFTPEQINKMIYTIENFRQELMGVAIITVDSNAGWVPLDVNFFAQTELNVDSLIWDFGDGDSSFVLAPIHTYQTPGLYDVSLEIYADGEQYFIQKNNYIMALADTMIADTNAGAPGETVEIVISTINTLPIQQIKIPVEYPGNVSLFLDSFSTVGCRTDYFEIQEFLHFDPFFKRLTIKLRTSQSNSSPDLAPGSGDILKLYFNINSSAIQGQSASVILDGYNEYLPEYHGILLDYQVETIAGQISVTAPNCILRGDLDNNGTVDIADLVYFVEYSFGEGPPPEFPEHADVDCSAEINIADIVYIVDYMFGDGLPPCDC